jgi:hypothetical protein
VIVSPNRGSRILVELDLARAYSVMAKHNRPLDLGHHNVGEPATTTVASAGGVDHLLGSDRRRRRNIIGTVSHG